MKPVADELDEKALSHFAREFLTRYQQAGFGRLPKREIDVLVFHPLERFGPDISEQTDTELAKRLGSTPRRIRGWRSDARYLYWDADDQLELVRQTIFGAIANDAYRTEADVVLVEVYDAFVKEQVVDILRRNHQLHDTSFNASILKLSRDAFWTLIAETLTEEQVSVLLGDERFRGAADKQTLVDKLRAATTGATGDLTQATGKLAVKEAAKLVVGPLALL